jgi:hypothetical protein
VRASRPAARPQSRPQLRRRPRQKEDESVPPSRKERPVSGAVASGCWRLPAGRDRRLPGRTRR